MCLCLHNTFSLFENPSILSQPVAVQEQDVATVTQSFSFSHIHHLTMNRRISVLTHQRLLSGRRGRQCTAIHTFLFVCYCFCLPCLVCQCRKFHLVLKCKSCEAQGHPQRENNGQRPAEEQTPPLNQTKRH